MVVIVNVVNAEGDLSRAICFWIDSAMPRLYDWAFFGDWGLSWVQLVNFDFGG